MEQTCPLYTNKDKERKDLFRRRKKGKKVRLTQEEDLKQKGDKMETIPSVFRKMIFFLAKRPEHYCC